MKMLKNHFEEPDFDSGQGSPHLVNVVHVYQHISAYELSPERVELITKSINEAWEKAKQTRQGQLFSDDGEFELIIYPFGQIHLVAAIGKYRIPEE